MSAPSYTEGMASVKHALTIAPNGGNVHDDGRRRHIVECLANVESRKALFW